MRGQIVKWNKVLGAVVSLGIAASVATPLYAAEQINESALDAAAQSTQGNGSRSVLPVQATGNTEENKQENTPASNAVDGDPGTFWSSNWSDGVFKFPNHLILDLGSEQSVYGLNYLPRQGNTNGNIGDYRIYVSNDPAAFGEPVVEGTFSKGTTYQTANLPAAVDGRYVKLEALSDVGDRGTQTTTVAELTVNVMGGTRAEALIPQPNAVEAGGGKDFMLRPDTRIVVDEQTAELGDYLAGLLAPATGFDLEVTSSKKANGLNSIRLKTERLEGITETGYRLTASKNHVDISASSSEGVFNGIQTLRQLLPAEIAAGSEQDVDWNIQPVTIADSPRYEFRSAMLDVGRRYYPVADVKRYLDYMAAYKLNAFHFHLTEDQGWRIAIDAYPELTEIGGSGQSGISPGTVDNGVSGPWFYSKDEYREIVDYAKKRFIEVIPEIDGPGHAGAAMASVPGLNCNNIPIPVYTSFNRGPNLCLKDAEHLENVADFLTTVIADVAGQTTTSDYIHLGGDESAGITSDQFTEYTKIANKAVAEAGKKVMGWNSWASGESLPEGAVLQNYGQEHSELNLAEDVKTAVENGNQILMSPADHTYLDIKYNASIPYGLTWIDGKYLNLARAFKWEPTTVVPDPDGSGQLVLTDENILGVEVALWADATNQNGSHAPWTQERPFDPVDKYMDTMLFPRFPAVAEVAWSAQADRQGDPAEFADFQSRVVTHSAFWDAAGIGYYQAPDVPWGAKARN